MTFIMLSFNVFGMLIVIMLSTKMLCFVIISGVKLSVILMNALLLFVVAPFMTGPYPYWYEKINWFYASVFCNAKVKF